VHPRDPYHRVDVLKSSRHLKILVDGEVVAETDRPRILFETGLPPRYYFPPEDVSENVPLPSDKKTEGHLCFFNEKVHLEVDGEAQQRPQTQWS
jgi:uncharacterized protein (DUF427 family)